ncbi:MAG: 3-isopropylmalate dehydratase large subunit [Gammaproteobacteria bacterium]|nr:3-isopropylmalate dehydratase large subunit [Gammaproteobacteria bacterium]
MSGKSLFEKVWDEHIVVPETDDAPAVLYIDLHLIHEVTTPQAFALLKDQQLSVRRPDLTLATMDHSTPTVPVTTLKDLEVVAEAPAAAQIRAMIDNCEHFGIELYGFGSEYRGIVHVIGPELGATQPGKTIVCGDSHTSTHGAFGALAFGIGSTEAAHVLVTQCLLQRKPKIMAVTIDGALQTGVSAKDVILALIGQIGVEGGVGHVIEYLGNPLAGLNMEQRMTICNMTIEGGARAGMMAPDAITLEYLAGRPQAPAGADWDAAVERWRKLPSDPDARFDREVSLDASRLEPMITFGTNPGMVIPVTQPVPTDTGDPSFRKALDYMQVEAGKPILGKAIDIVFIGSCTNSRMTDLRQAAEMIKGHKVADSVRMLVVPGSQSIKAEAEAEGLDEIFISAGAEWRESGCSMCLGMNGDVVGRGQLAVSTSNRNFEGRQGVGARTVLASPATAVASAISGTIADPRELNRH